MYLDVEVIYMHVYSYQIFYLFVMIIWVCLCMSRFFLNCGRHLPWLECNFYMVTTTLCIFMHSMQTFTVSRPNFTRRHKCDRTLCVLIEEVYIAYNFLRIIIIMPLYLHDIWSSPANIGERIGVFAPENILTDVTVQYAFCEETCLWVHR